MPIEMTLEQLKAHAYDCLAKLEMYQKELNETNKLIASKSQTTAPVETSTEEATEPVDGEIVE